jgi:hypothetical protein
MIPALASVDDLIIRINGIDTGADIRKLLYSNLTSATIQLKDIARLGKIVQAVQVSEEFLVDRDTALREERFLKMRLSNSFVDESVNVVKVIYGITQEDLDSPSQTPADAKFVKVDHERGNVHFDMAGFNGDLTEPAISRRVPLNFYRYIFRVTYDYGLATKGSKEGKIFTGVPDWLEEAALIKAREIYQLTNPAQDNKAIDNSGNLAYLIDNNIRVAPLHLDPTL